MFSWYTNSLPSGVNTARRSLVMQSVAITTCSVSTINPSNCRSLLFNTSTSTSSSHWATEVSGKSWQALPPFILWAYPAMHHGVEINSCRDLDMAYQHSGAFSSVVHAMLAGSAQHQLGNVGSP
ncbi:hypothetical protein V8C86DRAFT_3134359 [Haematococcus lacustris]